MSVWGWVVSMKWMYWVCQSGVDVMGVSAWGGCVRVGMFARSHLQWLCCDSLLCVCHCRLPSPTRM